MRELDGQFPDALTADDVQPVPPRYRWARRLILAYTLLALLILAVRLGWSYVARQQLAEVRSELGMLVEDWSRESADIVSRLSDDLPRWAAMPSPAAIQWPGNSDVVEWPPSFQFFSSNNSQAYSPNFYNFATDSRLDGDRAMLRDALERMKPVLDDLDSIARWLADDALMNAGIPFRRDGYIFLFAPAYVRIRLECDEGDVDAALQHLVDAERVLRGLSRSVNPMALRWVDGARYSRWEWLLPRVEAGRHEDLLELAQRTLAHEEHLAHMQRSFIAAKADELSRFIDQQQAIGWLGPAGADWLYRAAYAGFRPAGYRYWERLARLYKKEWGLTPAEFSDPWNDRTENVYRPIEDLYAPQLGGIPVRYGSSAVTRSLVRQRLTLVAVAATRFRLDRGRHPDSLSELVPDFLPEVPIDIYSPEDRPLRMLTDDTALVIYSVGDDGVDDGGYSPPQSRNAVGSGYDTTLRVDIAPAP